MALIDDSSMDRVRVRRQRDRHVVCDEVFVARRWRHRLRGLLGYAPLGVDQGLWLTPCRSIHMFGMRYALDLVFVDRAGVVTAIRPNVLPWRTAAGPWKPLSALEMRVGGIARCQLTEGDRLMQEPIAPSHRGQEGSQCQGTAHE